MTEDCTQLANYRAVDTLSKIRLDNLTYFSASEVLTPYGFGNLRRPE